MVSTAISEGNAQAINYFVAQKYVEAVSAFARSPNSKTILFPVEATQLIGSLGGIGEIARQALGASDEMQLDKPVSKRGGGPSVPGSGA